MKIMKCTPQKLYKIVLSFFVLLSAIVLFILGITLLPVLGILLSLPTFAAAYRILTLDLNDRCEIQLN